jgi:CRISPR-associated protein (TIGR03984 family)
MKTNGLTYLTLKTSSPNVTINSEQDILDNAPDKAWFIAYLYHRVVIGKFENKQFVYYNQENDDVKLSNILKLRVFNEDCELFVWKTSLGGYRARLRTDVQGSEQGIVEAKQVLFGTKAEQLANGYTKLTEDRGTEIILPITNLIVDKNDKRLCIKTRSYIGYIEKTGQATYEDVRFVDFVKYEEEKQ